VERGVLMVRKNRKTLFLVFLGLLAACGNNQGEKIYESWETAADKEKNISSFQESRTANESLEFDLFKSMSSKKTVEEINPLSEKAIASAEERKTLLHKERSMRREAYDQFQESLPENNNLEESIKASAEEAIELMEKRYNTYEKMIELYLDSIDKDVVLYQLLTEKSFSQEELEDNLRGVNSLYDEIDELNENFNHLTEEFNKAKLEFYSAAGLKIEHE
jgi:hypothetical protein